jgi:hypothetical protein
MLALTLMSCGPGAAHEFPPAAHTRFSATCPPSEPVCVCTWDAITRKMTYEEYQAALARFRTEGLMDTRITHARTQCVEHNPHHA